MVMQQGLPLLGCCLALCLPCRELTQLDSQSGQQQTSMDCVYTSVLCYTV